MSAAGEIARFERMGFATWPALEVEVLDGWELRFAGGVTGRANSVQVLADANSPFRTDPEAGAAVDARIARCEEAYRSRGLAVRFKLTEEAQPADLDARLAARGYERVSPTGVHVIDFAGAEAPAGARPAAGLRIATDPGDPRWFEANARLNGIPKQALAILAAMHERIAHPLCATCERDGRVVAVGLGAMHAGWLFLGEIATDSAYRRRGIARELVLALIERGRAAGARGAWLQVVEGNDPAIALYAGFGFRLHYRYWYRRAS